MVTAYAPPLGIKLANLNVPFAEMVRLSPPLSCSTSPVPANPETEPPTESVPTEQVTTILPTLAVTVPDPLPTVQTCAGRLGRCGTGTLAGQPAATSVPNFNG